MNLQEVTLNNLEQRGSVNDDPQGSQKRTLRYATVKLELSRKLPMDGNLLAAIPQISPEPVKHFPTYAGILALSLQQDVIINCVESCA